MKQIFLIAMLITVTVIASAQETAAPQKDLRINGYAGYVFDDKFDSYYDPYNYYNGKIKGGFQWGIGIEYVLAQHFCLELLYLRQDTKAPITYQGGIANGVKSEDFDLGISYILLGSDRHVMKPGSKFEGYAGIFAGVGIMSVDRPSTNESASATKFAWMMRLGGNIWASDKIAIKIQAHLTSVAQGAGGGFYFGTGGAGVGLSTYSTIYQFGFASGLTFRLGH